MKNESRPYYDLDVWKKSRLLVSEVYEVLKTFPTEEKFALISQMRRSVISAPSNIAEGIGRQHEKEKVQFPYIARGSLYELETQLFLALDQNYLDQRTIDKLLNRITDCKKLIHGYVNYLRKYEKWKPEARFAKNYFSIKPSTNN